MARILPYGVIKSVCLYCEGTEIPDIFALWSGIMCVSSALGREAFVDQGVFTVYPNLYVMLVAASAKCRKSTSIMVSYKFIDKVVPKINILCQKLTAEYLIGELSGTLSKEERVVIPQASGIAIADEVSTLIDKNGFASGLIPLLTKLYDCEDFPYGTRSRGKEFIKNPCLSLFGGSTVKWIKESIPIVSIGGGFTSRIIFVFKDASKNEVPWPVFNEEKQKLAEKIVHDLCEISKIRGAFAFTKEAIVLYSNEYKQFRATSPFFSNLMLEGYAGRRHVLVIKLSMILSASARDDKIVGEEDVAVAIDILRNAEANMPLVMEAITSEAVGDLCDEVFSFIRGNVFVTRTDLLRVMKRKMSSRELDVITDTLQQAGLITATMNQKGGIVYEVTKKK